MDDRILFVVEFTCAGKRYQYTQAFEAFYFRDDDPLNGPFHIPNRHNLRAKLDRERQRFEETTAIKIYRELGSMFGITYGPRMIQTRRDGLVADTGNYLEYLVCPPTMAEQYGEGLANGMRRTTVPNES